VEGPHATGEALGSSRHGVEELFITPTAARRDRDLLRTAADLAVPVHLVTDRVIGALSDTVTPQGVVAVVRAPHDDLEGVIARTPRLVTVLHDVADPGNAGTVIRTSDAAGADAVVLTGGGVDPHNPKCVRATAGSLFHLPVVRTTDGVDTLRALRRAGLRVVATTLDGGDDLAGVAAAGGLAPPVAWVFGNEAHGLPPELLDVADRCVRIPIYGRAESLNLAAAAAVCLYAAADAHRR